MATSSRLRGNQGLILKFASKDETPITTDLSDDVKQWSLEIADADDSDVTFYEAAQGLSGKWTLNLTGITSFDEGSLFQFLWTNPGTDFDVELGPWGNATPSTDKPHFKFTVNTGKKPAPSNQARTSSEGAEFEHALEVSGDVTSVTA